MLTMTSLFNLVSGQVLPSEDEGPAQRARIVVGATLAAGGFAALYGLAAGSTDLSLALSNVYKLPMVVLLSALCAVPAGLLAWKLMGGQSRAGSLLVALAASNFSGTLVLAAMAPIVALYYHSSAHLGGTLAMGAAYGALGVAVLVLVRAIRQRAGEGADRWTVGVPAVVLLGLQLACLVQFITLASPILPELTVFDGGMDAILTR